MISVAEARARILAGLRPVGTEIVALSAAQGRVLAEDVRARLAHPPADVSAMDGFAVRANEALAGARLKLIGAAPAGRPFMGSVMPGEAVRIFTGSFIPQGADAVLIQENASFDDEGVSVHAACGVGQNIRRMGQDFAASAVLLAAPKRLSARDIGLAAAGNHPWLCVYRRPRIAILATGDEIVHPGEPVGPGGVININALMLAALVQDYGAEALILPKAADDAGAISAAMAAARGADMVLTTGGASVGAHDLTEAGLRDAGFTLDFWKVAMRPGKPLLFGHVVGMPVLGLPGNPVSAFVCATVFAAPAIAAMQGLLAEMRLEPARLEGQLPANDAREDYVRVRLHWRDAGWLAAPLARQDSGMMQGLAQADALLRRAPHEPALAAGALVEIIRLAR